MQQNKMKKILASIYQQKAIAALLAVFLIMPFINMSFYTMYNMMDMLKSASVYITIGCGVTVVVISGACDLSVGGIMCLSGVITVRLMEYCPLWVCILGALLFGILVGVLNGFLWCGRKRKPL